MQFYKIDLIICLIKWSDLICTSKLTTCDQQMRVLESFYPTTNMCYKN
jgi:hypothetical protein